MTSKDLITAIDNYYGMTSERTIEDDVSIQLLYESPTNIPLFSVTIYVAIGEVNWRISHISNYVDLQDILFLSKK